MSYKGEVIEESLTDKNVLKHFKILRTRVEEVTERHKTPWIKQWTLHLIEVPDADAERDAELLSKAIDTSHKSSWYVDYKNETTHYIIFSGRIFKIDRKRPDEYRKVTEYGVSLGIPDYQLDFSPGVK